MHLNQIKISGFKSFAEDVELMLEPGVTAVAAPIHGPDEVIVGAINITGPTARIGDAKLRRFAKLIAVEAVRISRLIGGAAAPRKGARP